MKRNLFIIGLACLLGICTVVVIGWKSVGNTLTIVAAADDQNRFEVDSDGDLNDRFDPIAPTVVTPADPQLESLAPVSPTEEEANQLRELREQFVELAKTHADLLSKAALEMELSKARTRIADLHAARHLFDAQQTLQKLVIEFPDSPAAKRARTMLKRQSDPLMTPTPDSNFQPTPIFDRTVPVRQRPRQGAPTY